MTSPSSLASLTEAIVPSSGAVPIAVAPRQIAPVVLSFDAANYTKWAIFMRATLGHAGLLGHINDTIAAAPTDFEWTAADYTILNVLHSAVRMLSSSKAQLHHRPWSFAIDGQRLCCGWLQASSRPSSL
jgi:hypothetical protein